MKNKIIITRPPTADMDDMMDSGLISITEAISKCDPKLLSHGCLGGQFGYGAKFNNKVFMMHPYCWCEQDGCGWCNGEKPNFLHKKSGLSVTWYKWIGRSMEVKNPNSVSILKVIEDCINSLKTTTVKNKLKLGRRF